MKLSPRASSQLLAILEKDFRVEFREKTNLWVQLGFTIAVSIASAMAASYSTRPGDVGAATLGLYALFLSVFTGYSAFLREAYGGTLDGLRASPTERWVIFLAKSLLALAFILPQILVFTLVLKLFSGGLEVSWLPLLTWAGATSVFLAALTAFVSASLSYGEARAGPLLLLVLVLSLPYLKSSLAHLSDILNGVAPEAAGLLTDWLMAAGFSAIAIYLSEFILE